MNDSTTRRRPVEPRHLQEMAQRLSEAASDRAYAVLECTLTDPEYLRARDRHERRDKALARLTRALEQRITDLRGGQVEPHAASPAGIVPSDGHRRAHATCATCYGVLVWRSHPDRQQAGWLHLSIGGGIGRALADSGDGGRAAYEAELSRLRTEGGETR